MAGPQAQRPISSAEHVEGTSASRRASASSSTLLRRPIVHDVEQHHVEISVDDDDGATAPDHERLRDKDVEHGEKRVRHRRHRRPLYRRFISYIRNAWTAGVHFSSSNGEYLEP